MHLLVIRQQILATTFVPDEKLSVPNSWPLTSSRLKSQIQLSRIGRTIRQKANPHRRVNEDDHAAECLTPVPRSRRHPVSRA